MPDIGLLSIARSVKNSVPRHEIKTRRITAIIIPQTCPILRTCPRVAKPHPKIRPIIMPVPKITELTPKVGPLLSFLDISVRYARTAGGKAPIPKPNIATTGQMLYNAINAFPVVVAVY